MNQKTEHFIEDNHCSLCDLVINTNFFGKCACKKCAEKFEIINYTSKLHDQDKVKTLLLYVRAHREMK